MKYYILLFFILPTLLKSQDTITLKNDIKVLPIIYYLPETSLAFGVAGVSTFRIDDKQKRASVVQLAALYTLREQLLITSSQDIFFRQEKTRLISEVAYYRYGYNYYGIGIDTKKENFEKYKTTFPRLRFALYNKFKKGISAGLLYQFEGLSKIIKEPNGILDKSTVIGKDGGTISNLGIGFLYDSRDNILAGSKGFFLETQFYKSLKFLGSEFNYSKFNIDVKYYVPLNNKISLGFDVYNANVFGDAPFFDYYSMGSAVKARGIGDRRFRDKTVLLSQAEIRFPIIGRFRGALFSSVSTVGTSIPDAFDNRYIPAYGFGLRYLLNKADKSMVRVDVGRSSEGFNFYFTTNEAF